MKKLMIIPLMVAASLLAALTGCQTTHIKTPEWEASINSHWFKRDVDKLDVKRNADGGYSISLNGYKADASEQLPAFTREMFAGLVAIGQLIPMAAKTAPAASPATPSADGQTVSGQPCTDGDCAPSDPATP